MAEFEVKIGEDVHTIDIDAVPSAKVDAIRAESYAKGIEKATAEATALKAQLAEATAKLTATTSKAGSSTEQVTLLTESLNVLKTQFDAMTQKATNAERNALIIEATSGLQIVDGAIDIFKATASTKAIDGGYLLPSGETGDIKAFAKAFFESTAGKALVLSSQKGGTGSKAGYQSDP